MQRTCRWLCIGLLLGNAIPTLSQQTASVSRSTTQSSVVPPLVSFSGVLNDLNGKPMTSVVGVTFALYRDEQGGPPLWLETQNVYPNKAGHYTVLLGSTRSEGIPADLFVSGEARWLAVQVQGLAEQARVSLSSAPYAIKAGDAQTIGGLPASAFVLAAPPSSNTASEASAPSSVPLAPGTTPVTTAGGTINMVTKFDAAADITNSQIFDNGTNVGIGTTTPAAKLDVKGTSMVRGLFSLPAKGTATATTSFTSQPFKLTASVFNSGTATAVPQNFQWQAEPVGNNTTTASGTLNLLYSTGTNSLAETGMKIANNGQITFVAGQTFPGTGTITGVTAGSGLSGGGTSGNVSLFVDTAKVPQLQGNNVFTGNQSISGNFAVSGVVGIATTAPTQSLEVDFGNALIRGPGNFKTAGNTAFVYVGDTAHSIEAIYNTGLALGSYLVPQAVFIQDRTGNVGIGTTSPDAALNVVSKQGIAGHFSSSKTGSNGMSVTAGPGSVSVAAGIGLIATGGANTAEAGTGGVGASFVGGSTGGGTNQLGHGGVGGLFQGGTGSQTNLYGGGVGLVSIGGEGDGFVGGGGDGAHVTGAFGILGGTGIVARGGPGDPSGCGGAFFGGPGPTTAGGWACIGGPNNGRWDIGADGIDAASVFSDLRPTYAGNFTGDLNVTGTIYAGTKDFRIDHPLDPANKYLSHASVESSEMKDLYDGTVTTDEQGDATVDLPSWFEAVNGDFRYQLTVVGQFAQAIVAQKIANHQFRIKTDKPNVEVCWQVSGVRLDAFAQSHPLIVEEVKPGNLRGFYIHPELYGQSGEKQIEWGRHPAMMKRSAEIRTQAMRDASTRTLSPARGARGTNGTARP